MKTTQLKGIRAAQYFAQSGRFIFAIKHLQIANPGLSREEAKSAIASFHYGDKAEHSETVRRPLQAL
jgi:hypothetical protein